MTQQNTLLLQTPEQAAQLLQTTPNVLAVWRTNGRVKIPYIKLGRAVRYRLSDIEAFIEANTFEHTAKGGL